MTPLFRQLLSVCSLAIGIDEFSLQNIYFVHVVTPQLQSTSNSKHYLAMIEYQRVRDFYPAKYTIYPLLFP